MVEFEFAVGEPGLYVEMVVMPRQQFEEFCATQAVVPTRGRLPEHGEGQCRARMGLEPARCP